MGPENAENMLKKRWKTISVQLYSQSRRKVNNFGGDKFIW